MRVQVGVPSKTAFANATMIPFAACTDPPPVGSGMTETSPVVWLKFARLPPEKSSLKMSVAPNPLVPIVMLRR